MDRPAVSAVLSNTEPLISSATLTDVEDVYSVALESFASPWPRESFEQDLEREWAVIRVLRPVAEGNICGFSHFWLVGDEVQLQHLAVLPEKRRCGFGRALVRDLAEIARDHAAKNVWLEVRRSNLAALNLYLSFGFEKVSVRPRYYSDNDEDAITARLVL
jgi:ribosomal-protein-alanine N-acetyltransferase